MAEGARLESVYTATYRGFESPPHRHIRERARTQVRAFFSHIAHLRGDEKPPTGVRLLAQPVGQTGSAANGLLRRSEQSESIPPSPPYSRKSSYASTGFFFAYTPYRLSTSLRTRRWVFAFSQFLRHKRIPDIH